MFLIFVFIIITLQAHERGLEVDEIVYEAFRSLHYKNREYTDVKFRRVGASFLKFKIVLKLFYMLMTFNHYLTTQEDVERHFTELSPPLSDSTQLPPVDANAIYLEVSGGIINKNRIFGIVSLYTASQPSSPAGPS